MGLSLNISHIYKTYNDKPALHDCTSSFDSGGVFVLMGPNGSGKSTLLRICALIEPPDAGQVLYTSSGDVVPDDINLRRRITLVLPRIGVFNTTVFGNAAYGLKMRKIERREIERRVDRALDAVGLIHKRRQNALTLSSGETQRLGIARAMVIEPRVLFLDEPTASIDEKNTKIVEGIILSLKKEGKTTIIITTHDREQAERLGERVIVMHEGRISAAR